MMDMDESKKGVFRNRRSVLKKLEGVDLVLLKRPEGKDNYWNGDPGIVFSRPISGIRHGGKELTLHGVCLFTSTSKMGAGSLGIPAGPTDLQGTCPASRLHEKDADPSLVGQGAYEDQICRKCYALKGNFVYELPQLYQAARYEWIRRNLKRVGVEATATELADAIQSFQGNLKARRAHAQNPVFFRVHDSGDMTTDDYWEAWKRIVELCEGILFWIPTRMHWLEGWRRKFQAYEHPRLVVRPSAYHFNDPAPEIPGMAAGSTSHYPRLGDPLESGITDFVCPAYAAEGACADAVRLAMATYRRNPGHEPPHILMSEKRALEEYRKGLSSAERRITNDGWDCRVCWIRPDWRVSYKAH